MLLANPILVYLSYPREDVMDGVGEVEVMSAIADKYEIEGLPVVCARVIGDADLVDENVEELLKAYAQAPRCTGVRDSIMSHEAKEVFGTNPDKNKLYQPAFRRGFALLKKYDLSFETWVSALILLCFGSLLLFPLRRDAGKA